VFHTGVVSHHESNARFYLFGDLGLNEDNARNDNLTSNTHAMRRGGPMTTEQRNETMALFLASLRENPNISLACDRAGISREGAYNWREKYKEFSKGWEEAIERTRDTARSSFYQRAVHGWDEPVTSMGKVVYDQNGNPLMLHKWSDTLANTYAKANLPEYKEKQQIDINADIQSSSAITIDTRSMSPKQLVEFKAFALKLKEASNG